MLCQIGEFEAPDDTYGLQLIFDESTRGSKRIRSQGAVRPYVHTSYELHSRALTPSSVVGLSVLTTKQLRTFLCIVYSWFGGVADCW